jgi:predicted phosphodiesterase
MITVISDVHGKQPNHLDLIEHHDYTLQLGDLGFCYKYLEEVDPEKHQFFPGNHDNYDICYDYKHCIGDFGLHTLNHVEFYFVRGAFSIDWHWRVSQEQKGFGKSWWGQEQLSIREAKACLEEYADTKPDLVITHTIPREVSKIIGNPGALRAYNYDPETFTTNTQELLQAMLEVHQPDVWVGGHFHKSYRIKHRETYFIGLAELETYDV